MFISIIVPVYKDIRALELILNALDQQTYKNFEVVLAEDDESEEVAMFVKKFKCSYKIKHFHHKDIGSTTKPTAVNAAVKMSEGEYLIYIDGDTIPYSTFVDAHAKLATKKYALCGRRVNLGPDVSSKLRSGELSAIELENNYLKYFFTLNKDKTRHYEQGIYLRPNSLLQKMTANGNQNLHLLGSNFSCYKADMLEINGSDEDMPPGAGTDDVDIEWRLRAIGVSIKSCKNTANLFHLYHKRNDNRGERSKINRDIIAAKQAKNLYRCKNGIIKD